MAELPLTALLFLCASLGLYLGRTLGVDQYGNFHVVVILGAAKTDRRG